jgi:acyl transferase domain-containing protein/acyl carrier protein
MTSPNETRPPTDQTATLKRAYLTMERMQRRIQEYERARSEPIAVVGLGLRFPGGAVDADSYWGILESGSDVVSEIPADRWDIDAFYAEEHRTPGKMSTRYGGFLDRVDRFDYDFFGISRREALAMDPQQRLTLEVVWEALENAGQAPTGLAGSRTGVFLGVCSNDFATRTFLHPLDLTAHASTGTAHSVVPGRVSYVLDLRGPSVAVDSACSASLLAVHQACQSLRAGECDMALGGGVNVVVSPYPSIAFSQFPGMVSVDGRCKTFDAAANGYVRGEGCGIVVLKRLSDAVRDGDRVLALLRGAAVNQDGRSSGVTAPNGAAQRDVLRRALEASGVEPREVSYIEAHGTGTTLGDPIEVDALAEVYGREEGTPLYLGSSKTNIGHLEAASGIAGLIKVVLSLQRGAIPATVHFQRLNPHISFDGTTFAVPAELTDWPVPQGQRVAGVSSFGFSGTNVHMIVAEGPEPAQAEVDARRPQSVLALSAKSETALADLARRYAARLDAAPADAVHDICHAAATGRSHFRHRLAAVGATSGELAARLTGFAAGTPGEGIVTGEAGNAEAVFLFTGQGPQRVGMARGLYETQPTFRRILDQCDEIMRPMLDRPLLSVIYPEDPADDLINQTLYSQPALFAVEYALAEMWRAWGVEPVAVLGHSFGEYMAACVAGAMTLEDGLKLTVARGHVMQALAETGAMAAVFAPEIEVAEALFDHEGKVAIAAVNGPANTAISGEREAVEAVCEEFTRLGVRAKVLRITTASHSPLMDPVLDRLRAAAEEIRFTPPRIPLVSNLTGELWPWEKAPDADYWCAHARQPVLFGAGVGTLLSMGHRTFLEAGPAPTLLGLISDALPADRRALLLPSLRPKQDDWQTVLSTLSQLYAGGAEIDWRGFDADYTRSRVSVPTYAFDPTHCWQESRHRHTGTTPSWEAAPEPGADEYEDADLLYELAWQPADGPAAPADPAQDGRTWLVLADTTGVGDHLAAAVTRGGARCVRVVPGEEYRWDGGGEATVRLDDADDLVRLLTEVDAGDAALDVVHLWSLGHEETEQHSATALLRAQQDGCMSAVRAAQALARTRSGLPTRLWLVTRGAVRPTATGTGTATGTATGTGEGAAEAPATPPLALGQSTLWGLGRSLQQEHAGIWGGLVDLDPVAGPEPLAAQLLGEITGRQGEDQIALRDGNCHVARLVRTELPHAPARRVEWRPDASYLITGGLGGIGLAVARSMVQAGARRLVLVGRTPIPPRGEWAALPADTPAGWRVAAVRELEALGASVIVESLDVSDEEAARGFLERFDKEGWPPIRGVVHAAGIGEVAPLLDLEPDDLERHLLPKAVGAWVLHRLFAERPLDFFVLFSSASSVLSSPFVAGYAAANAFLDSLARLRREEGKPGLSVNWGIWSQTGMATRGAEATPGLSRGMGTLTRGQALRVFHRLLEHDVAQIAVTPVDWSEWGRRYQEVSGSALLATLVERRPDAPAARASGRRSLLPTRDTLLELPEPDRVPHLTEQLLRGVAATLGADPSSVGVDKPLSDLGLDSLMAVELRNEIEGRLGASLSISVFLQGASVGSLAATIVERLADGDGGEDAPAEETIQRVERFEDVASRLLAELDALPDEQAATEQAATEQATDGEGTR